MVELSKHFVRATSTNSLNATIFPLEVYFELAAHRWPQTIKELANAWAANVVLNIARVKVICYVENRSADTHLVLLEMWNAEAFSDLHIKREK